MIKSYEITPDEIRIAIRAIEAEAEYNNLVDQNPHLLMDEEMDEEMDEKTIQRMFEIICRITSTYKYQFAIDIAKRAMESCREVPNINELKTSIDMAIISAKHAQHCRKTDQNSLHRKKISQTDIVNLKIVFAYEKKKITCIEKLCDLIKKVNNSNSIEFQNIEKIEADTTTAIKNAKRSINFWSKNGLLENKLKNAIESVEKARIIRRKLQQDFSTESKKSDNTIKTQLEEAIINEKNKVTLMEKLHFSFEKQNKDEQNKITEIAIKNTKQVMQRLVRELIDKITSVNNAIKNVNSSIKSVEAASYNRLRIYNDLYMRKRSDNEIDNMEMAIEYEKNQVISMKEHTVNLTYIITIYRSYEKNKHDFSTSTDPIEIAKKAVGICSKLVKSVPNYDKEDNRKYRETIFNRLKSAIILAEDAIHNVEKVIHNIEKVIHNIEAIDNQSQIEDAIVNIKNKITFMEECIVCMEELFQDIIEYQKKDDCTCVICLEPMYSQDTVRLQCSHVYHKKCIDQCREQCSRFCPMCKRPITNFFFYV